MVFVYVSLNEYILLGVQKMFFFILNVFFGNQNEKINEFKWFHLFTEDLKKWFPCFSKWFWFPNNNKHVNGVYVCIS